MWTRRASAAPAAALNAQRDYPRGLIAAEPDLTIAEMQERLRTEGGVSASAGTIWTS